MKRYRLELEGHVPCKKSRYRIRSRKTKRKYFGLAVECEAQGLIVDPQARSEMDYLQLQLNKIWSGPPLRHASMYIRFYTRSDGEDRDGKLVTILDVLQAAGVIAQDNIRHWNGWRHEAPAVISNEEKTVIIFHVKE